MIDATFVATSPFEDLVLSAAAPVMCCADISALFAQPSVVKIAQGHAIPEPSSGSAWRRWSLALLALGSGGAARRQAPIRGERPIHYDQHLSADRRIETHPGRSASGACSADWPAPTSRNGACAVPSPERLRAGGRAQTLRCKSRATPSPELSRTHGPRLSGPYRSPLTPQRSRPLGRQGPESQPA